MPPKKKPTKTAIKKSTPKKVDAETQKRRDWETNNELISEAFFSAVLEIKKFPTYQYIADKLDLDEKTVRRHMADGNMFQDLKDKMKMLSNKAMITLAAKAIKGDNVNWMRLFFEVTADDKDKGKDNHIQIFINGKPNGAKS